MKLRIRGIKLRIHTDSGPFGFEFRFGSGLTVVKGGNSSGKSTFFNLLLYALGLEELVGGRGPKSLPYAVKDHFDHDGTRVDVQESEVLLEIAGANEEVVTVQRWIKSGVADSRLVSIFERKGISELDAKHPSKQLYLHDPGAAQSEFGFHAFLADFIGSQLPVVPATGGGETRLYLQSVFAAIAVEQKRGWTDYIANIPFFGIKEARSKVAEFLLGLNTFEAAATKAKLLGDATAIEAKWANLASWVQQTTSYAGARVDGVPHKVDAEFNPAGVSVVRYQGETEVSLSDYLVRLRKQYAELDRELGGVSEQTSLSALSAIQERSSSLSRLGEQYQRAAEDLEISRAGLREVQQLLDENQAELEKNRGALKLRKFGAEIGLPTAMGQCPTCHQPIQDVLLPQTWIGPQMDLETNIHYLESQSGMLSRQVTGLSQEVERRSAIAADLYTRLKSGHEELSADRKEFFSGASQGKSTFRRQLAVEKEIESLERLALLIEQVATELAATANEWRANVSARRSLPASKYDEHDERKVRYFEKSFRANASSFGYESAPISEVELNRDTLVPYLSQMELREIRADIRSDSSASDFVRLIWSYLLALYQASSHPTVMGNHPRILMFDEPGQHSMAEDSQRALLQHLSDQGDLQSIVAASFDESESVFLSATDGVSFELITWDGKIIKPISQ